MPRIKLAHWHGPHAPGDEIDVDDAALKSLVRDGRVATVVVEPVKPAAPVPAPTAEAPAPGRKRQ